MGDATKLTRSLQTYCVGHKRPEFAPASRFTMVCPLTLGMPDELVIPEDHLGEGFHGSILSEYTQLFGLADHLLSMASPPDSLYLFQYRKFVGFHAGSRRSSNISYAYACNAEDARRFYPKPEELQTNGSLLLTGPVVRNRRSMAYQYGVHHLVEDFSAFSAACALSGAMKQSTVLRFINCPILIPSPALGLIPTHAFVDIMRTLRQIWAVYAQHFLIKRDGYQRRVGGFLLERLHSFLLTEYIRGNRLACGHPGHLIIISASDIVEPTR